MTLSADQELRKQGDILSGKRAFLEKHQEIVKGMSNLYYQMLQLENYWVLKEFGAEGVNEITEGDLADIGYSFYSPADLQTSIASIVSIKDSATPILPSIAKVSKA